MSILAESEGFEPPIPCGIPDFESGAISRALPTLHVLCIFVASSGFTTGTYTTRCRDNGSLRITHDSLLFHCPFNQRPGLEPAQGCTCGSSGMVWRGRLDSNQLRPASEAGVTPILTPIVQ